VVAEVGAGRMSPASITKIRNDREARARRHLELARLLRDNPDATNIELAKALNVDRHTITTDRLAIMSQVSESARTETQLLRDEQLAHLADLRDDLRNESIRPAERIALALGIVDRVIKLTGTAAPSRSIVGHVSGPQLDALYLEIRAELLDLNDGDRQEALLLMREFAKSRKKPVVWGVPGLLKGNSNEYFS
jgi:hypothetical protein